MILYMTYHYNDKGYRVSKTVYDAFADITVTTNYFLNGDSVYYVSFIAHIQPHIKR